MRSESVCEDLAICSTENLQLNRRLCFSTFLPILLKKELLACIWFIAIMVPVALHARFIPPGAAVTFPTTSAFCSGRCDLSRAGICRMNMRRPEILLKSIRLLGLPPVEVAFLLK